MADIRQEVLWVVDECLSDLANVLGKDKVKLLSSEIFERIVRIVVSEIDASPAVLWAGKGGVKERLEATLND